MVNSQQSTPAAKPAVSFKVSPTSMASLRDHAVCRGELTYTHLSSRMFSSYHWLLVDRVRGGYDLPIMRKRRDESSRIGRRDRQVRHRFKQEASSC